MSQIKIRDTQGNGIPLICIRIAGAGAPQERADYDVLVKTDGTTGWPIPHWPNRRYELYVNEGDYAQPEWSSEHRTVPDDLDANGDLVVTLNRAPVGLSQLTVNRSGFYNAAGERVFLAGVSAFMHYERYLKGEDIRPLLEQAASLGANCLRVFGMAHYIPVNAGRSAFKPQDYGDRYFDEIPNFCRLAESYGFYVYWSVFPDNEMIGVPDPSGFFDRVVGKLKEAPNTIGELTNEQDAHSFNHIDPNQMHRPSGIAFCSGSYGDIGEPQPSPWDFCDYHQPRRYEPPTHIKDGCVVDHPSYLQGFGILLGEPDRYGTDGNPNTDQARQSAGACRETALGMFFHSTHGRESQPYDDATIAIARVFFHALIGAQI